MPRNPSGGVAGGGGLRRRVTTREAWVGGLAPAIGRSERFVQNRKRSLRDRRGINREPPKARSPRSGCALSHTVAWAEADEPAYDCTSRRVRRATRVWRHPATSYQATKRAGKSRAQTQSQRATVTYDYSLPARLKRRGLPWRNAQRLSQSQSRACLVFMRVHGGYSTRQRSGRPEQR